MNLTSMSVTELLAAFRSAEPTPGGGSAAALAGAVGASLLAMVAGLPNARAASDDDIGALRSAGEKCGSLARQLEALVEKDTEAYEGVVAAFRLPKGTDEEKAARTSAIQAAMRAATEAPLEVMRRSADALALLPVVSEKGNANASSDAAVGREMLAAAIRGGLLNVQINLGSIKDAEYVSRVRTEAESLATAV